MTGSRVNRGVSVRTRHASERTAVAAHADEPALPVYARLFRCFFFFQAEDGIRDYKVTGVQTCALPISLWFINTYWTIIFYQWFGIYPFKFCGVIRIHPNQSSWAIIHIINNFSCKPLDRKSVV